MIDWFFANMEKCYYLWAPGDHKRFTWIAPPNKVGMVGSLHSVAEQQFDGAPLHGPDTLEFLDMSFFPFTTAFEHVLIASIYIPAGETFAVHQWEAADYGTKHRITLISNGGIPAGLKDDINKIDHSDYEEARWCVFLPTMYALWKDNLDPWQNVQCDLRVKKLANDTWAYVSENKPPAK